MKEYKFYYHHLHLVCHQRQQNQNKSDNEKPKQKLLSVCFVWLKLIALLWTVMDYTAYGLYQMNFSLNNT